MRCNLVRDDNPGRFLRDLGHDRLEDAFLATRDQLIHPRKHYMAHLIELERRSLHQRKQFRCGSSDDLRATRSQQSSRPSCRRRGDGAERSAAGEANYGCGRRRRRLGVGTDDQQLDVSRLVVGAIQHRRENVRDRGPVVRHLINNVLPPRHRGLFCFLIHFVLDCAVAAWRATWHTDSPMPSICRADKYSGLRKTGQMRL